MRSRFGPPEEDDRVSCDSGSDRTVVWPALFLVFADDRLVGYSFQSTADPAATPQGIRIGSTGADLRAAYPAVRIEKTTSGAQWFVDTGDDASLGGTLDGFADTNRIDRISSGDTCGLPAAAPSGEQVGVPHRLLTHCGVASTTVAGVLWLAHPPLGDHNAPPGWDENETTGTFTRLSDTEAEFRATTGAVARFRRAPTGAPDPNRGCE